MANICSWSMKVVGKTKKSVERVLDILSYKDSEFCVYRCWDPYVGEEAHKEDGLWTAVYRGQVAWSCAYWFMRDDIDKNGNPVSENLCTYGQKVVLDYEKGVNGNANYDRPIHGEATFRIFQDICKALNVGVEVYAEETDIGFQTHDAVNNKGILTCSKEVDYTEEYCDEDGDELDEPIIEGGWDDYGKFKPTKDVFIGKVA